MSASFWRPTRTGKALFLLVLVIFLLIPVSGQAAADPPEEDQGTLIENLLALPINGLYNALMMLGFKSFDELIFNNTYGDLAPFTSDEWYIVMRWYSGVRDAVWVLLVIAVAVAGYRHIHSSYNPSKRASLMQSIEGVIYAFAVILFMPYIVQLIFQGNNAMVSLFHGIAQGMGAVGETFNLDDIKTGSVIATAIVKLGYVGLLAYFNFLYLIRKFVLTSMLIITPIVAWTWTISGRKEGIGVVLGEIASNAFMQAAHALVLSLYLTLLSAGISSDFSPWWAQIFGMVCLIPTANVIRDLLQGWLKLLGVNEESWAGMATMGLMGFAGLSNIAKTTTAPKLSTGSILGNTGQSGSTPGGGTSGGGTSAPPPAGAGQGGPGIGKAVSVGMRAGNIAGSIGRTAGAAIGSAMSIPLRSEGVNLANIGGNIGGTAGTAIGRQAGTGYSILRQGQEATAEMKAKAAKASSNKAESQKYPSFEQGVYSYMRPYSRPKRTYPKEPGAPPKEPTLVDGLGKVMGTKIKSGTDVAAVIGKGIGTAAGSAFGFGGAMIGNKVGGAAGRYGLQTAGIFAPILTANVDKFRWH